MGILEKYREGRSRILGSLGEAVAGTRLHFVGRTDYDLGRAMNEETVEEIKSIMGRVERSDVGVCVQSSSLGAVMSLEQFLKTPEVNIPVSTLTEGPVHKKHVLKALSALGKKNEFATILAFDVQVTQDAQKLADELGVMIFTADIVYHLFNQFKAYVFTLEDETGYEEAVFPCALKVLPKRLNPGDPCALEIRVLQGTVKIGTPLCTRRAGCLMDLVEGFVKLGRVVSIEHNNKPVEVAKKGQLVIIKVVSPSGPELIEFGGHVRINDELLSHVNKWSIRALKANYQGELSKEDWRLIGKLRDLFKIK